MIEKKVKGILRIFRYTLNRMDASSQTPSKGKKLALLILVPLVLAVTIGATATYLITKTRIAAARFLRPQETVAVFTHAEKNTWKAYNRVLPVLDTVPAITSQNATLAIVKRGNTLGWVLLGDAPLTATAQASLFATPTVAMLSSLPDWQVANETETTLAMYAPFTDLSAQAPDDQTPFAYVDIQQLKAESRTSLDSLILSGAKHWPAVLLWSEGQRTHIYLFGRASGMKQSFAPALPALSPLSSLILSAGDGNAAWTALMEFLPQRERMVLQGRVEALIKTTLGNDISLQYDLLPLLKNGSMFTASASGFLLEGKSTGLPTEKSLTRMMESVRQDLPQSSVDTHTFERGFVSTILSPSSTAIVERRQSENGFAIHTIWSVPEARGVGIARKGEHFRLANDFSLLLPGGQTKNMSPLPLLSPLAQAHLAGWVRMARLEGLLQKLLGLPAQSDLLPDSSEILFALRQEGTITHIVLDQLL